MVGPLIVDGNSGSGLCLLLCPGEPPRRGAPGRAPAGWLLYDGHVIAQSRPVAPRAHAWLPLTLRVSAAGLDATLDRAPLFEGVQLPKWRPADHWRLALIARSRSTVGDAYWVDNVRVRSASLADALLNNTKVTALNLSECNIGDQGLMKLADAISGNATVRA